MTVETEHAIYHNCWLMVDHYLTDSSLAIWIKNNNHGAIAKITTCLDRLLIKQNEAFVDVNNCPWAEDFIRKYRLGEPTGQTQQSGFCTYPLYRFDMNEVKKWE